MEPGVKYFLRNFLKELGWLSTAASEEHSAHCRPAGLILPWVRSEPICKKNDISRIIKGRHDLTRRTGFDELIPLSQSQPWRRAEL